MICSHVTALGGWWCTRYDVHYSLWFHIKLCNIKSWNSISISYAVDIRIMVYTCATIIQKLQSVEGLVAASPNHSCVTLTWPTYLPLYLCFTLTHSHTHTHTQTVNKIGAYVVCFILGEFFHLPSLSQLCLAHIQSLLTVNSALVLVPFAEAINCPLLREVSVAYLKIHHTPWSNQLQFVPPPSLSWADIALYVTHQSWSVFANQSCWQIQPIWLYNYQ